MNVVYKLVKRPKMSAHPVRSFSIFEICSVLWMKAERNSRTVTVAPHTSNAFHGVSSSRKSRLAKRSSHLLAYIAKVMTGAMMIKRDRDQIT